MIKTNNKAFVKGFLLVLVILVIALILRDQLKTQFDSAASLSAKHGEYVTHDELKAYLKDNIKGIIEDDPDMIINALTKMQKRQAEAQEAQFRELISKNKDKLRTAGAMPHFGSKDAKVVVNLFFDYRCGYCRKVAGAIHKTMEAHPEVLFIFREFPILGERSGYLSRIALALYKARPENYKDFHFKLMASSDMNDQTLAEIVKAYGISLNTLQEAANSQSIKDGIAETRSLAESIQVGGTPMIFVNEEVFSSDATKEVLDKAIAAAK